MKFGLLILLCLSLIGCGVQPVRVVGNTMKPALSDGDKILVEKNPRELKRGDIVTFIYPKDRTKFYIKRIIGLPGEVVEIRAGRVYINGAVLDEPYIDQTYNQTSATYSPQKISERAYFVLGDNRDNSSDSRSWGTVGEELITGKYYATYSRAKE